MGKTLYLECTSGISGDMTVAALLDAGAREDVMRRALDSLPVQGFEVRVSRVKKSGLDACDFDVVLDVSHENHDHDMAYLHGHESGEADGLPPHAHQHDHAPDHAPDHSHAHQHDHVHEHRSPADIYAIIDAANMTDRAKATARRVFEVLAQAEAAAHGTTIDQVHFHEVGAVDSIVDIVAAAVCLDDLQVSEVIVPALSEGQGTVRCQHGIIPVPVPATVNIAATHGIALRILPVQGELVTPTGAAFVAATRTSDKLPERFTIEKVGIGAGKREYATPGILRAMVIVPEG